MKSSLVLLTLPLVLLGRPMPAAPPKKAVVHAPLAPVPEPKPKDQVVSLRRIVTQALGDIEQRLSTEDLAKLAPYREDPETTRELLLSILQDRIGALKVVYAEEMALMGPEGAQILIELKSGLLKRGIRRLNNWKPEWKPEQIEKMVTDLKDTVDSTT